MNSGGSKTSELAHALLHLQNAERLPDATTDQLRLAATEALRSAGDLPALLQTWATVPDGPALIGAAAQNETVATAQALAAIDTDAFSKPARKAARKALYVLKSKGIEPLSELPVAAAMTPVERKWRGFMTAADASGYQATLLIRSHGFGYRTLLAALRESTGVENAADSLVSNERSLAETIDGFNKYVSEGMIGLEVDAEFVRRRVAEAVAATNASQRPLPYGMAFWTAFLPEISGEYIHPIWNVIDRNELPDSEAMAEDASYLNLDGLATWSFEINEIKPTMARLAEITNSPIEVAEDIRRERFRQVVKDASVELFTPETTARYVRRLEDAAYLHHRAGVGDMDVGRILKAAVDLEEKRGEASFAFHITGRTIAVFLEIAKAAASRGSRQSRD